jgi:hypothetical protein
MVPSDPQLSDYDKRVYTHFDVCRRMKRMTIGLTCRRTSRKIKRLKETVLTIPPDYSDRPTPDFLALSYYAD